MKYLCFKLEGGDISFIPMFSRANKEAICIRRAANEKVVIDRVYNAKEIRAAWVAGDGRRENLYSHSIVPVISLICIYRHCKVWVALIMSNRYWFLDAVAGC